MTFRATLKEEDLLKYAQWHQEYFMFRKAATLFVIGAEHFGKLK